eukprot:75301_1
MAQVNPNALPLTTGPPWTAAALKPKHKAALLVMVTCYSIPGIPRQGKGMKKPVVVRKMVQWGANPSNWAPIGDDDDDINDDDVGAVDEPAPGPAID